MRTQLTENVQIVTSRFVFTENTENEDQVIDLNNINVYVDAICLNFNSVLLLERGQN